MRLDNKEWIYHVVDSRDPGKTYEGTLTGLGYMQAMTHLRHTYPTYASIRVTPEGGGSAVETKKPKSNLPTIIAKQEVKPAVKVVQLDDLLPKYEDYKEYGVVALSLRKKEGD